MAIQQQRITLCLYLRSIAEERKVSIEQLSLNTGIAPAQLACILDGGCAPQVDELIAIANELDMQLTFQQNICFAHKKAGGQMRTDSRNP